MNSDNRGPATNFLGRSSMPQLVLRIGYGQPAFATHRRQLAEVIDAPHAADLTD